ADLTVRNTQRGIADLARLLTEDRTQQPLLRGQLGLTLRGDLADEDVSVSDLGADADDAAIVEVGEGIGRDVRDVPGDLLGAGLGVAGVDLVLLGVYRRQAIVLDEPLGADERSLTVVPFPGHA